MVENQNSSRITKNKIDEAINLLQEQKPKEREDISERVAVRKMKRYIEKLTSEKYGYTYDEVSEMLKGLGINLSGSRIKYLLGEVKKNTRRRQKAESSDNKSTSSTTAASENQPTVVNTAPEQTSSETESIPVTTTKGKTKNKQSAAQQQSAKSNLQGELNNAAFVPKIYRDEDL